MNFITAGFETAAPRLGMTLIHSLWQGAVMAMTLAVTLQLLRTVSSALRYAVCCGAMVLFVTTVAITFAVLRPMPAPPIIVTPVVQANLPPILLTIETSTTSPQMAAPSRSSAVVDPLRLAGFAWMIGAAAVAFWHLLGWLWIRRCVRGRELDAEPSLAKLTASLGIHRAIRLVESSGLNVPAVVGVIRPVILIPLGLLNDLAPDQIQAILIHELAHIRRHDYLVNLLQVVVESLLFYHPATWWISSQIRREREHCCDDIAASRFTAGNYVSALLALEQRRWPTANTLVAATGGTLLERVQRLLGRGSPGKARPIRSAIAAMTVLACIFVPIALDGCDKSKSSNASPSTAASVGDGLASSGITAVDFEPDYSVGRIGFNDLISVAVNDLVGLGVETTKETRVSDPNGTISMPLLPEIKVQGLTEAEAGLAIAKAYKDGQIITNAQVSVTRLEAQSTVWTAIGNCAGEPGEFAITKSNFKLTTALACARAKLGAQTSILLVRKDGKTKTRTLNIPVGLLLAGDQRVNVYMRPGDVLILQSSDKVATSQPIAPPVARISEHGEYYIGGTNTKRVGVYALPAEKVTLKQAIIAAGGADDGFISLFRRDGGTESLALQNTRYSELLSGAVDDLFVHPGDTIMFNPIVQPWQGSTTQKAVRP